MLRIAGYLDKSGAPAIKLSLSGPVNDPQEFEAIIDTGFSGFVSMPILRAFPLGLILRGTTNVTFADGNTATKLYALGRVTVAGASQIGIIVLEEGSTDVLIGMDFLVRFEVSLLVHPSTPIIALIDKNTVDEAFDAAAAAAAKAEESPAPVPANPTAIEAPASPASNEKPSATGGSK